MKVELLQSSVLSLARPDPAVCSMLASHPSFCGSEKWTSWPRVERTNNRKQGHFLDPISRGRPLTRTLLRLGNCHRMQHEIRAAMTRVILGDKTSVSAFCTALGSAFCTTLSCFPFAPFCFTLCTPVFYSLSVVSPPRFRHRHGYW